MEQVEMTCNAPKKEDMSLTNSTMTDQLMTPDQVADFFMVTRKTISNWTNEGKLNMWGVGGRRYYKMSEIIDSLVELNPCRHER